MPGREHVVDEPYYQHDTLLGTTSFAGRAASIHLQLHVADEPYFGKSELFPLQSPRGRRTYVHAKPYLLEPEIELRVALFPAPPPDEAIGQVVDAETRTFRRVPIGQAQAWYYPAEDTLVLWECYLEDRYRTGDDPLVDPALRVLWNGFERWLLEQFPDARRLVTTWEDDYERPVWARFLEAQDYLPLKGSRVAFSKSVAGKEVR